MPHPHSIDPESTGSYVALKVPKKWARLLTVSFSTLLPAAPVIWYGGGWLIDARDQWLAREQRMNRIEETQRAAQKALPLVYAQKAYIDMLENRLEKAERQLCVLGWDPGGAEGHATRNADRKCEVDTGWVPADWETILAQARKDAR